MPSPSDQDILRLQAMLTSLDRIASYLVGYDEDRFVDDPRTVDAVAMNLLVIGECVSRLNPDLKAQRLAPWPGMVNLRHRLAHAYATIAPSILFDIAAHHGPKLRPTVLALLDRA